MESLLTAGLFLDFSGSMKLFFYFFENEGIFNFLKTIN